ncbi:MAG: Sir2 family NAD-dependent protein deacetylase [Lachnospiraceae bacterium]
MKENGLCQLLQESKYTVVLSGFGMLIESGYPALRDGEESYDVEQKYGYSTEEIFHSEFFSTRKELFFEFYRNEVLSVTDRPAGRCFYALAELERRGLIQSVITRRVYGLPKKAGCQNVVEMHGSVYENYCPHCGEKYSIEFMKNSKRVPLCTKCSTPIRPNVTLFGEMVDNAIMTKAAEEVEKADVLLILGTNLKTYLCEQLVRYYQGDKVILISKNEHFSDKLADLVIHQRVDQTLDHLLESLDAEKSCKGRESGI